MSSDTVAQRWAMIEPARVFEDRERPGDWRVDWFDGDGGCEVKFFTGAEARDQARRYAEQRYGTFELKCSTISPPATWLR